MKMLEEKKNAQVDIQHNFENNFDDYNFKSGYIRAIDMDFLYAEQIEEQKRIIKNQKARIKRLTAKGTDTRKRVTAKI